MSRETEVGGMSLVRRLAVAVVVVCLTLTLFTGNVLIAAHQTVLDPGYVTDTVESEDGYEAIHAEVVGNGTLPIGDGETLPPFALDLVGRIVTPEYIQNQTEQNVERLYGYLHGSESQLVVAVDTRPLKQRTETAVAATVRNTSAREIAEFAGVETQEVQGVSVSTELLFGMEESQSNFQSARSEVRDVARERALDRLVQRQFDVLPPDRLLPLVIEDYDSDEYTDEEKRELVAERESEIRAALRERTVEQRGDEIDALVSQLLNESRPELKSRFGGIETGFGSGVDTEARDLVGVYVDGLLAPNVTYDEFDAALTREKAQLGDELGAAARNRLDTAAPDRLVVTDVLPAEGRRAFVRARAVVVLLDVLGWLLPLLALALAGQFWVVADEEGTALLWTGVSGLAAGGGGLALGSVVGTAVSERARSALPDTGTKVAEVVLSVIGGVFQTLSTQSLLLLGGGVVFALVGGLARFDVIDLPWGGGGGGGAGGEAGPRGDDGEDDGDSASGGDDQTGESPESEDTHATTTTATDVDTADTDVDTAGADADAASESTDAAGADADATDTDADSVGDDRSTTGEETASDTSGQSAEADAHDGESEWSESDDTGVEIEAGWDNDYGRSHEPTTPETGRDQSDEPGESTESAESDAESSESATSDEGAEGAESAQSDDTDTESAQSDDDPDGHSS